MRWRAGSERALRRVRAAGLRGWISLERDALLQMAKTALAAMLSWALSTSLLGSSLPALAALAAIIVVQVTVYQTLARALQYVVAVVLGVLVALVLASALGVHAWSIGVGIFGALVVGRALRLGPQANQVAISALLVLSLGGGYGTERMYDALLGAVVGVLVNLLLLPPTYVDAVGRTLRGSAEDLAELCRDVGEELGSHWRYEDAHGWLGRARDIDAELREAGDALDRAEESVRYKPRGRNQAEALARYHEAFRALDHAATQIRGIVRALTDLAEDEGIRRDDAGAVVDAVGDLLQAVRHAVRAFGSLQTDEAHQRPAELQVLRTALEAALEARDTAARRLRTLPAGRVQRLLASTVVDAERLLTELDPDAGQHTGALPAP